MARKKKDASKPASTKAKSKLEAFQIKIAKACDRWDSYATTFKVCAPEVGTKLETAVAAMKGAKDAVTALPASTVIAIRPRLTEGTVMKLTVAALKKYDTLTAEEVEGTFVVEVAGKKVRVKSAASGLTLLIPRTHLERVEK